MAIEAKTESQPAEMTSARTIIQGTKKHIVRSPVGPKSGFLLASTLTNCEAKSKKRSCPVDCLLSCRLPTTTIVAYQVCPANFVPQRKCRSAGHNTNCKASALYRLILYQLRICMQHLILRRICFQVTQSNNKQTKIKVTRPVKDTHKSKPS